MSQFAHLVKSFKFSYFIIVLLTSVVAVASYTVLYAPKIS